MQHNVKIVVSSVGSLSGRRYRLVETFFFSLSSPVGIVKEPIHFVCCPQVAILSSPTLVIQTIENSI